MATSSGKQGKQGKWSKKIPCREKSGNFEKKMKIREKSGNLFCFLIVKCLKIIIFKLFRFGYWWFLSAILVKQSQLQFLSYYNEHVHI